MNKCLHVMLTVFIYSYLSTAVASIKVHCLGQGKTIFLVGGGPAFSTWNLEPIQKKLSGNYKVCRWDMRGVGDNTDLMIQTEVSVLEQWLQDMQNVLPQEPVLLWGHSWGALQALLFAEMNPGRVYKLILSNPVDPDLRSLENIEQKRFNHHINDSNLELDHIGTDVEQKYNFKSKIASYFVDAKQGWEYASKFNLKDSNSRLNIQIWDEYKMAPLKETSIKQLEAMIGGLIYCQHDVLQPENLSEYRRLLKKSKHYILNGCGHFPWVENPDDYYDVLLKLLEE